MEMMVEVNKMVDKMVEMEQMKDKVLKLVEIVEMQICAPATPCITPLTVQHQQCSILGLSISCFML
jgi:hypothetical protein